MRTSRPRFAKLRKGNFSKPITFRKEPSLEEAQNTDV